MTITLKQCIIRIQTLLVFLSLQLVLSLSKEMVVWQYNGEWEVIISIQQYNMDTRYTLYTI